MTDYYQQEFVSPTPIIAQIKEELKSYFSVGVCDELLIPIYIDRSLRKLGRGVLKLDNILLPVNNSTSDLPEGFKFVKELWLTTIEEGYVPSRQGSVFQELSFRLNEPANPIYCDQCIGCATPEVISAVYRTTSNVLLQTRKTILLEPGNLQTRESCKDYPGAYTPGNKFDLSGTRITVEFPEGLLYLQYYKEELTEDGYQLIPDDLFVQEYIEAEIKAKLFENISNSVTDETYNQVAQKMQYYRRVADEKLIEARINMKKRTPQQTRNAILRNRNRMRKYNL